MKKITSQNGSEAKAEAAAPVNGGEFRKRVCAALMIPESLDDEAVITTVELTDYEFRRLFAESVNGGERDLAQVIDERDRTEAMADKLAIAIGEYFGIEIGEHSSINSPWQCALDFITTAERAADAPQVAGALCAKCDGIGWSKGGKCQADKFACVACGGSGRAALASHAHVGSDLVWAILTEVREALRVPLDTPASDVHTRTLEAVRALTSPAKVGGDELRLPDAMPAAYLSTEPNKWDRCTIRKKGTFTVPVYTAQQVQDAFDVGRRATLSADGGDRKDAEHGSGRANQRC
ncbi:hypothetical protein PAQ31011_00835 [Pandoraea aquatica]|uniref:Uncharacterized protein n=1 Tax=Pandoraea aquatica TaxID=2508290 RepID=A0A5E4SJ08_9BURK|nr:hypothetical protein [Pandoraea aquatica]VVD75275.1 hypothetical protein PAQ31011_00835 [Pandoraea aquatica]